MLRFAFSVRLSARAKALPIKCDVSDYEQAKGVEESALKQYFYLTKFINKKL
jgi:hypothetical protein